MSVLTPTKTLRGATETTREIANRLADSRRSGYAHGD